MPCDERAGLVDREYHRHAERLDEKFYPARPFERRLGSFGSVVGFVAGYFGELSKGAHEVLAMAAEKIAERTWIEAGATILDHAKSIQKQRLYREWGVASVSDVALIKIEGLAAIGAPSSIPRPDYEAGPRRGLRPRGPRHGRDLRRRLRAVVALRRRARFVVVPSPSPCSCTPLPWPCLPVALPTPLLAVLLPFDSSLRCRNKAGRTDP